MKILLFILFIPLLGFSQVSSIKSTEYLEKARQKTYLWLINGQEIIPNTDFQDVKINFPEADTIIFFNNQHSKTKIDTVITRLAVGEKYVFTISCCNDNYNIYNEKTYLFIQNKLEDIYNDSLPQVYKDSIFAEYVKVFGNVKIEVTNIPKTDSLIVFADYEMFAYGNVLITEHNSISSSLLVGDFTNRHYDILFVKYDNKVKWRRFEQRMLEAHEFEYYNKLSIIKEINVRVFESETALVKMDYLTNKVEIKFEKN